MSKERRSRRPTTAPQGQPVRADHRQLDAARPVVTVRPHLPISPNTYRGVELRTEFGHSVIVSLGKGHDVRVPIEYTFSAVDEKAGRCTRSTRRARPGRGDRRSGHQGPDRAGPAPDPRPPYSSMLLRRPRSCQPGGAGGRGIHPSNRDSASARARRGSGDHAPPGRKGAFEQILERLRSSYGDRYDPTFAVGSHGRQILREFLNEDYLLRKFDDLAVTTSNPHPRAGWHRTPLLYKGRNAGGSELFPKITQLEMRLVPKWYKIGDSRLADIVDTRRFHHETTDDSICIARPEPRPRPVSAGTSTP